MGCGLPKLEKADENSPGKIYSTLKRPQVETKVGIAYQYKLLDFTTADSEITESSAVKLSSLHDLPAQLQELYQKGFVLAGFHPFIQSIDMRKKTPEEKMFRAILIKPAVSTEENNAKTEPCSLEVELCLLSKQPPNSKVLADVLQKIQEGSRKGLRFVGLVQHQNSTANSAERPEEASAVNSPSCQNISTKEEMNAGQNVQNNINKDKLAQNQKAEATAGEAKQKINQVEVSQSEGQAGQDQVKGGEQINGQPIAELTSQEYQKDEGQIQNESTAGCEAEAKVTDKQKALSQAEAFETKAADRLHTEGTAGGEQSTTATNEHTVGTAGGEQSTTATNQHMEGTAGGEQSTTATNEHMEGTAGGEQSTTATNEHMEGTAGGEQSTTATNEHTEGTAGGEQSTTATNEHMEGTAGGEQSTTATNEHMEGTAGGEQSTTATNEHTEMKQITESNEANATTIVSEANDSKQGAHSRQGKPEENGKKNGVENEVFLLFNKPQENQKSYKYYTATIPLKICKKGQDINSIEADWLEHMTQHFTKGALLVDALICLGTPTDSIPKSVDGLFIFEGVSEDKCETYDAIVVEQWTVIHGVEVKTDYVPLLNSLAAYGWQLTCVLPTPIVKRDSEGSLATKQIVFLQRPSLPRKEKKKETKKKSIKDDKPSKQDKNCLKDKNSKVTAQAKNSTGDSDEKEKQEQSAAKNGDKGNAENGISLKTETNDKESIPAAVQDYVCVTNAEMEKCAEVGGCVGENTVSVHEASGNNNFCEKEDTKDEQEERENKCQNGTISRCEEEASQAKVVTPLNGEYAVTNQELGSMPAAEVAAAASGETDVSSTEITDNVPEEREGVITVQDGDGTVTE
ncbi:raftlin-like [Heptranchias perlo]|uniref:raftlin-like n=1 Tax=Heptranchias perlo TaxID=212740 RepID=UPI00355A1BC9